ncbi:phosphotransferase [Streptomyces sp. NPDC001070]
MTSATFLFAHQIAAEVVGPLKGHHHEAYAVRLDPDTTLGRQFRWLKLREPREHVFWYDHRCFGSEEQLISELSGRVKRIPKVVDAGALVGAPANMTLVEFIEGQTLGNLSPMGSPVRRRHRAQIAQLFGSLASIDAREIRAKRVCGNGPSEPGKLPYGGDGSTEFLRNLIDQTRGVFESKKSVLESLFDELDIPDGLLDRLADDLGPLTPRPFVLLHGDLHRENLIVDHAGELWTIDWELARIGDPLYDLATHLHLMRYPRRHEREAVRRWRRAVGRRLAGATEGVRQDLPRYRAYKRVQSVYTDVMRGAMAIAWATEAGPEWDEVLGRAVASIAAALTGARRGEDGTGLPNVGLKKAATPEHIEKVLLRWHQEFRKPARSVDIAVRPHGLDTVSGVEAVPPLFLESAQNGTAQMERGATV